MAYQVKWHEKAVEDLKDVDKKSAKGLVERVKEYLPQDPIPWGSLFTESSKDFTGIDTGGTESSMR